MTDRRRRPVLGIGQLGRRIILTFLGLALATIVVDIAITAITGVSAFNRFVRGQEITITHAAAATAADAYVDHGGWHAASLGSVLDVAGGLHASVRITDSARQVVASSPGFATAPASAESRAPVIVGGRRVGTVTLRFGHRGLTAASSHLLATRWRARIYAGLIALALAFIVSVPVAMRITRPIDRTLEAMRARSAGDRDFRIKDVRAVGELGELLEGFNQANDSVDRQERALRNLVADVAHELRTPVAVLQAGHEAILDGITEATPENIASLHDEVLRLSRSLDDLRQLAAAEAAALQLQLTPHDLAGVAADAATALSDTCEMASLHLRSELSSISVLCDYDRLREVIANLLTNAIKYTPAGGTITLEAGPDGADQARLRVSDTGIGIPADELPHVTERFFRGRRAHEIAAGSGFGLTIVSELVTAHHGDLQIASQPGAGTQVTVTLPQATSRSGGPDIRHPLWRPIARPHAHRVHGLPVQHCWQPYTRARHTRVGQ